MAQDLELWVLEHIGMDPSTPDYGSTLDGGVINGVDVPTNIGQIASQARINEIRSEILALLTKYQKDQIDKIKSETVQYAGQTSLTPDEVIQSVDSITAAQAGTVLVIRVLITTATNTQFKLLLPMPVDTNA